MTSGAGETNTENSGDELSPNKEIEKKQPCPEEAKQEIERRPRSPYNLRSMTKKKQKIGEEDEHANATMLGSGETNTEGSKIDKGPLSPYNLRSKQKKRKEEHDNAMIMESPIEEVAKMKGKQKEEEVVVYPNDISIHGDANRVMYKPGLTYEEKVKGTLFGPEEHINPRFRKHRLMGIGHEYQTYLAKVKASDGFDVGGCRGGIPGGIGELKPTSGVFVRAIGFAKLAIEEHNAKESANLEYVDLVRANVQAVSGGMYYITARVRDNGKLKIYRIKYWYHIHYFKRTGSNGTVLMCEEEKSKKGKKKKGQKKGQKNTPKVILLLLLLLQTVF